MNNLPLPFYPQNPNYEILLEINKLKEEIIKLNKRIDSLEKANNSDYLKKNDEYYII